MSVFKSHKGHVTAVVHIPKLQEATFGRDLSDMLQARKTFEDSIPDLSLGIMTRQRLKIIRDQLFGLLDTAAVV